jgi:hypothetical protein
VSPAAPSFVTYTPRGFHRVPPGVCSPDHDADPGEVPVAKSVTETVFGGHEPTHDPDERALFSRLAAGDDCRLELR